MSTTVLVLGGAGAQNSAVVRALSEAGNYMIQIMTRDTQSTQAGVLATLPNVSLVEGDCYDDATLFSAFKGVEACFVNTNGFAIGEKSEIYWGIRMYEIARGSGVKHFVYGGLPYVSKNGGFDPKYRVPFVDGKGKVGAFLSAQATAPMAWTNITSGPYAEQLWEGRRPTIDKDGVYVFRIPLADGAMPFVSLDDLGKYVVWALSNPDKSNGLELGIAIDHVTGQNLAEAFTAVSGKAARYENLPMEVWSKSLPEVKVGRAGAGWDDPTLTTVEGHFRPWFGIFHESAGNKGPWSRDYKLLDDIMPTRIRTIEEWMRKVGYNGEFKPILKTGLK